ncbi:acylphosphatase [Sphingomonas sp. YR710]|nr:acylphosphatase [Sphingomonas sp. YR710]
MRVARRIVVRGRVQGVWYRGWTQQQARAIGLDGWVRNRQDGSVEIAVAGMEADVTDLIARCHQGPQGARVDHVEVEPYSGDLTNDFVINPTS